jgi:hypothetical protein
MAPNIPVILQNEHAGKSPLGAISRLHEGLFAALQPVGLAAGDIDL